MESEQVQTLRFLVETHRTEFDRRRSYQWRGIVAGLSFGGLIIAARMHKDTAILVTAFPDFIVWTMMCALWIVGSIFLGFAHAANAFNKEVAHRAEAALQKHVNGEDYIPINLYEGSSPALTVKSLFKIGAGGYWGWLCESLFIFTFSVCAALIVTAD